MISNQPKSNTKKITITVIVISVVLCVSIFCVANLLQPKSKPNTENIQETNNSNNDNSKIKGNETIKAPDIDPSITPNSPSGTFVSNHNVKTTDRLESNCLTTPGASCQIQFTKNSETIVLESKTADSSGNVYWDWSIQETKLTEGKWTITAIASSGSKTAKTTDSMPLTVGL